MPWDRGDHAAEVRAPEREVGGVDPAVAGGVGEAAGVVAVVVAPQREVGQVDAPVGVEVAPPAVLVEAQERVGVGLVNAAVGVQVAIGVEHVAVIGGGAEVRRERGVVELIDITVEVEVAVGGVAMENGAPGFLLTGGVAATPRAIAR